MRRSLLLSTAMVLSLTVPGLAAAQQSQPQPSQQSQQGAQQQAGQINAQQFVQKAAASGQFEVESSRLAQDKAQAPAIKQFAQRMVQDHTQANQQLQQVAQSAKMPVPNQLDQPHQQMMQRLQGQSGQEFDRTYIQQQAEAHQNAVQLFQQYAQGGDNQQLQQFAQQTLPTLQQHLDMARNLQQGSQQIGAAGQTGSSGGAQINVQQPSPQVTVQQRQPEITVQQPQPQVTVQQPPPQVTVQQPQPQVTVQQQQPQVRVEQQGQPQVTVQRQGEPQVNVQQQGQQPGQQAQQTPQAQPAQRMAGLPPEMRVEQLLGQNVYSRTGDNIGDVEDLIIDPQSGQIRQAIVSVGGFLGIGEHEVALDFSELQYDPQRRGVVVDTTRDRLKALPEFQRDNSMVSLRGTNRR